MSGTGNESSFRTLWSSERPRLEAAARRILRDRSMAEDVVQEAFLRLVKAEPVANPGAWLSTVVTRLCLDKLRSASLQREITALDSIAHDPPDPGPDPADRITLDDEVRMALNRMLDLLSPAQRVAFVLHDVFALSYAEIGDLTGRSEPAVRQLASRSRRRLTETVRAASPARTPAPIVQRFQQACRNADVSELVTLLHDDAWGVAHFLDGQLDITNHGAGAVAASLIRFLKPPALVVAGEPDMVCHAFHDATWFASIWLDISDQKIRSVTSVVDPPKEPSLPEPTAIPDLF